MSKKNLRAVFRIFVLLFAVLFVQPVFAHGDEPRLEISVERLNPGGTVEVRGVDFDPEEVLVLSLMSSSIQISLDEVTTDVEGVFTQIIVLPSDLPTGEYNFRARSEHHLVRSPTIAVWGAAVENQENNSVQDQSDMQFGPIPTLASSVSSTPLPQATALPQAPASKGSSAILIYLIVAAVAIVTLLGIRILNKR
jgi:hypothetical protein